MTVYKLNEDKMFADVADGIAIIINSETGIYYGMNELGTEIYNNLINGVASENVLDFLRKFDSNAEVNYKKYIDFIIKNEIMIPSNELAKNIEIRIDENILKQNNYIPEIKEYLDAQELLLADPIHEVKEEEGWSPEKSSLNEDKEDVARREAKMENV